MREITLHKVTSQNTILKSGQYAIVFLVPIVRTFGSQFKILMFTLILCNSEMLKITKIYKGDGLKVLLLLCT